MTEQHSITPPPELMQQWRNGAPPLGLNREHWIATQAARWGSDKELEVCLEWLFLNGWSAAVKSLRDARRPKPPSLKKQALTLLDKAEDSSWDINDFSIVRRALELLPND